MGGTEATSKRKKKGDVIIPQTGAAKYWYVDPGAGQQMFDPMSNWDEQGHQDLLEILKRIGVSDQSTPSF